IATPVFTPAPWSVALLPYLEYQTLYDRLTTAQNVVETLPQLLGTSIQVYTCPDDPGAGLGGTLSFAVNAGYTTDENWALAQAGSWSQGAHAVDLYQFAFNNYAPVDRNSVEVQSATGVFVEEFTNDPTLKSQSFLDRMSDGQTHTVVLTENLQAEAWYSPNPRQVGVVA